MEATDQELVRTRFGPVFTVVPGVNNAFRECHPNAELCEHTSGSRARDAYARCPKQQSVSLGGR